MVVKLTGADDDVLVAVDLLQREIQNWRQVMAVVEVGQKISETYITS